MGRVQNYDPASVESIVAYASHLIGKSLSEQVKTNRDSEDELNKGDLGTLVQTQFFGLKADNLPQPDFSEAGLELKTTGVVKRRGGEYAAKERLVLSMINFGDIIEETWETSALLKKCRLILLLAYFFEKDKRPADRTFVLGPFLLDLLSAEFKDVKRDWEEIREKVRSGRAHELSEGDTFILGACRKGSGGTKEALRDQPNSLEGAKARAFAFKPKFVTQLLQQKPIGAIPHLREVPRQSFSEYLGMPVEDIADRFEFHKQSPNQKGYHRQLANRMLSAGGSSGTQLQELGIEMKTIRINPKGRPKEHMSFPGFKFMEIIEEEWESSNFFYKIESKFLFVVFQTGADGQEKLHRASYWNMPYQDRVEAMKVWEETKKRVLDDATKLPKPSESRVAHVRPKGRNGQDKIPTPQGTEHLRQAFWLNNSYIADVVAALTE